MEQSKTRLAVLLATCNGESYIGMQLDSLFHQTCQDFTLYIHDDGSTDGTLAVIETYRQQYPERLCVLEYEPQGNARDNFLSLLQRVQAEYYMFCDQDDCWLAEKVQISLESIQDLQGEQSHIPCLVFSDLTVTDSQLHALHFSYLEYKHKNPKDLSLKALLRENVAPGCTILCNQALANHGNYYSLHKAVADDGRLCPVLVRSYAVYAERGLLTGLTPARDSVFYYSLCKTMENALMKN